MVDSDLNLPEPIEGRWLVWGRSAFAVLVVGSLIVLGLANVITKPRWHEVEDGVLWAARAEGLTAAEVAADSSGAAAGVQLGDLLLAVNGAAVESPSDVVGYQHRGHAGSRL